MLLLKILFKWLSFLKCLSIKFLKKSSIIIGKFAERRVKPYYPSFSISISMRTIMSTIIIVIGAIHSIRIIHRNDVLIPCVVVLICINFLNA